VARDTRVCALRMVGALVVALAGCRREPTREQVVAPLYRDHRALPELAFVPVERCEDVPTVVVTRDGVHVDATALGDALPWAKRRDALPEDLRLDWPLAHRDVAKLRGGYYPLDGDHEQRVLRDVLTRVVELKQALPGEPHELAAILTVDEDVPMETTMRTLVELQQKFDGPIALATSAGCATRLFPNAADGRGRVRITAVGDRYTTTPCAADADGKLNHGPERWTADQLNVAELGGRPEYCAAPGDRTIDVLRSYARILPGPQAPAITFVVAARRQ